MKERKVSEAEKQVILETIKKVEDENPIVDFLDEDLSLENRLQDIDINNLSDGNVDEIWCRLTPTEREEFKKFAESGSIQVEQDLNKAWTPWWMTHNRGLITEVGGEEIKESLPPILAVASFSHFSSGKPVSPLIGFNLINVIYSYVFYQRLYNGCGVTEFTSDFCELCISSSKVLNDNRTYNNSDESVCSGIEKCSSNSKQQGFNISNQFSIECIQDVAHILVGPNLQTSHEYVACCLSDLHAAAKKFRKSLKSSSKLTEKTELPKKLFAMMKKLEYFLSWCICHPEQLALLAIEVTEIYKENLERLKEDAAVAQASQIRTKHHRNEGEKSKQCLRPKIVQLN